MNTIKIAFLISIEKQNKVQNRFNYLLKIINKYKKNKKHAKK